MKNIQKINKIALIITLLLYLTYFFGLMAQVVLGVIQVIFALIITIKFFTNSKYARKNFSLYWSFVLIEFLLIYLGLICRKISNDFPQILIFSVFPISIAIYFTIILNKINNDYENDK